MRNVGWDELVDREVDICVAVHGGDAKLATGRLDEPNERRWSDVDLDAGQLAIVQTLTTINGKPTFGATKSSPSPHLSSA